MQGSTRRNRLDWRETQMRNPAPIRHLRGVMLALLAIGCTLGLLATSAHASKTAWDQATVTELAAKLQKATQKLYDDQYKSPESGMTPGTGSPDAHFGFMDSLRRLEQETRHLASSLAKGAGHDATRGSFLQIHEIFDDVNEDTEMMYLVGPVKKDFDQMKSLIDQLQPYYHD